MARYGKIVAQAVLTALVAAPALWAQEKAEEKAPASKVKTVEISPATAQAEVGQTLHFTAAGKDADGKPVAEKPQVWFAAPFDVAGADEDGNVIFHAPGEVTVGAVIGGQVGFARVTVANQKVTKIEIASPEGPLPVGGSMMLTATARAANGNPREGATLQWASDTPAIARVDASGLVTGLAPGHARVHATADGAKGEVTIEVAPDTVAKMSVEPKSAEARTGDVVHFRVEASNLKGAAVKNAFTRWSVSGEGAAIYPDGGFVAERPGTYVVTASSGRHSAAASVVVAPRNAERELEVVAHVPLKDMQMAEEWIIGHHAYVSTIADKIFVYDIADPAKPKLLDSLKVDARLVNDLSTTPDETVGVMTREGASNRKNGIVFFDPSDPAHLKIFSEYTETVTGGVHSAFINTHYVYLTDDATGSMRVIDFADPRHPKEVARWQTENSTEKSFTTPFGTATTGRYLHDLYVNDGLAYLAYWRDGLIILDVGNGMKGGSPEHPQLVSQYKYNHYELYGNGWLAGTHSVFRYKNYVFTGDEVFPGMFNIESKDRIPVRAIVHVMDVSDLEHPKEVAWYEVPEGGTHNFWADDDKLYLGDYAGGGRVIDISGELRGDLYREGREIASLWTGDPQGFRPNLPFTWGGQPWNGLIYFNDINSGLWITKLGKPKFKGSTTAPPLQQNTLP